MISKYYFRKTIFLDILWQLKDLKNALAGPIRFELWPQVRKVVQSNLRGHCIAAYLQLYVAAAGKTSRIVDTRPQTSSYWKPTRRCTEETLLPIKMAKQIVKFTKNFSSNSFDLFPYWKSTLLWIFSDWNNSIEAFSSF